MPRPIDRHTLLPELRADVPGVGRLGRHIRHDPRSLAYRFDTARLTVQPVRHVRHAAVFDQGDVGSCVGNAAVGAVASDPLFAGLPTVHPTLDEQLAVEVYTEATRLDDYPGEYPDQDTGTDGLAGAKALQADGWIAGYQHTFALDDALKALTLYPVMVGVSWYSSFDSPNRDGLVKIGRYAYVRGGHELVADEVTQDGRVGFTNSWGSGWGVGGRFYMTADTFGQLLDEQGDVTVPLPRTDPAPDPAPDPTPTPGPDDPPAPSPDDVALWADVRAWAKAKGLT